MRSRILSLCCAALLAGAAVPAAGAAGWGLIEAYDAAYQQDPAFRAATHELEAGRQALPIARAALLPSISYNANHIKYDGERTAPNAAQDLDYTTRQDVIGLRQALFNVDAYNRYRIGATQVRQSEAAFAVKTQELAIRVASAYFAVLLAQDTVALVDSQLAAYSEALVYAQRRRAAGEGTRTEETEALARRDLAQAQLLEARDQLETARRDLQDLIGTLPEQVLPLRADFRPSAPEPAKLEAWIRVAIENSPAIASQRETAEAARLEVSRARGGHYPRVDLVAAYSDAINDSVNTLNQEITTRSIGVQAVVPIYSGGLTSATTEQAVANRARAESELDAAINTVQTEVRKQHLLVTNGVNKVAAYEAAVRSSETAVEDTRKGVLAGTRINLDVFDAQARLVLAQRTLAEARYTQLVSLLRLKAAAGVLKREDIADVDRALVR
jgi:protease secretion system outer membrane protein